MGKHFRCIGNGDAPQTHGPGGLFRFLPVRILVDVISVSDTRRLPYRIPQHGQILGRSDFDVSRLAVHHPDALSAEFQQSGVIRHDPAFPLRTFVCGPQPVEPKALWGLDGNQPTAIRRRDDDSRVHDLDGINDGNAGNAGRRAFLPAFAQTVEDPIDQRGRRKGPRRIMHQNLPA